MKHLFLLIVAGLALTSCTILPHPKPNKPVPSTGAIKEHLTSLDASNATSQKHVQTAIELADQLDALLAKIESETAAKKSK